MCHLSVLKYITGQSRIVYAQKYYYKVFFTYIYTYVHMVIHTHIYIYHIFRVCVYIHKILDVWYNENSWNTYKTSTLRNYNLDCHQLAVGPGTRPLYSLTFSFLNLEGLKWYQSPEEALHRDSLHISPARPLSHLTQYQILPEKYTVWSWG